MSAIVFPLKRDEANSPAQPQLDLPGPCVWAPKHLADFLGVSISWIYKRTESGADDPIPRVAGVGRLRFDTHYPAMDQAGICRQKGHYGFHIFRHTAGSIINAKTRDLKLVQETLGHSQIGITANVYVHLDENAMGRKC